MTRPLRADPKDDLERRLRAIGAIVSARLVAPAIVLVTGAAADDDTSALAHGLARSFSSGGYRTAYASAGDVSQAAVAGPLGYDILDVGDTRGGAVGAELDALARRWREAYEIVLLDVPALLEDRRALRLARLVDGVLVALRTGRAVTRDDADTAALLATLPALNLGVVKTGRRARPVEPIAVSAELRAGGRSAYSRA